MKYNIDNIIVNLKTMNTDVSGLTGRVSDLESTVGDTTGGLVKDVDDLQTTVGDATGGLVKDIDDIMDLIPATASMDNQLATMSDITTPEASNVSYDNTSSGLTADDVQEAIDELADDIGDNYSNSETVIGTWLGSTLYRKVINTGALPNATTKEVVTGLTNVSVKKIYGVASRSDVQMSLPSVNTDPLYNVSLTANGSGSSVWLASAGDRSSFTESYTVLEYTKL